MRGEGGVAGSQPMSTRYSCKQEPKLTLELQPMAKFFPGGGGGVLEVPMGISCHEIVFLAVLADAGDVLCIENKFINCIMECFVS